MDKSVLLHPTVKKKRGFALMITLSVLSVIIALTMVLLSYFEKVQEDATNTKALIQANLYYANIVDIFTKFKDKKQLFSILYTTALPLRTPDGQFSLYLNCQPMNTGINVNWLGFENNSTKQALYSVTMEMFEGLSDSYKIEDLSRLLEMIKEEIATQEGATEEPEQRLFQKKRIISYLQFSDIISRYQFEVDDPNVSKIPWEKYFSFYPDALSINIEYSSAELIATLFDIDVKSVREWKGKILDKEPLQTMVTDNGGDYGKRSTILESSAFLGASECMVTYGVSGTHYRFKFEYIGTEAKYFEFYANT